MDKKILDEILRKHDLWLEGQEDGERANLSYANLRSANLRYANLRSANLRSADLRSANLSYANLRYANLRSANLRSADLRSADLSYANLSYANLRSANLRSADLRLMSIWGTRGNNTIVKSIHCDTYDVSYTDKILQIGCQHHNIEEWWKFNSREIADMDGKQSLKWWKIWKPILKKIIKYSPAENNGFKEKPE